MTRLVEIIMTSMVSFIVMGCSNNDDNTSRMSYLESFYAIVQKDGAQETDINPEDYVLTLENIIAVNPETGQFLMNNTEQIDSKAFPIPTQYVISFYSQGKFLFKANLNSAISSYMRPGLTFCHFYTDKNGTSLYYFQSDTLIRQDGTTEGETSDQQNAGMRKMYDILSKAGKVRSNIEYDFQFE